MKSNLGKRKQISEEEQWRKRKITNRHKETFGDKENVPYFYYTDGFIKCIHTSKHSK